MIFFLAVEELLIIVCKYHAEIELYIHVCVFVLLMAPFESVKVRELNVCFWCRN